MGVETRGRAGGRDRRPLGPTHRADGDVLLPQLLAVACHHLLELQLLHDLLLLQVRVLLLGDGARQLLRVRLGQRDLQLGSQGVPV